MAEARVRDSFKAILVSYMNTAGLTSRDVAHLRRWSEDDRADEEWRTINRARSERGSLLPPNFFIAEILAMRRVAEAVGLRAKYRDRYRMYAEKMEEIARFLRKPHPAGMPPTFPSEALARMLDRAAEAFRTEVDPSRDVLGVVKLTRKSGAPAAFMSLVSNHLKELTGRRLDGEAATLTEIAFQKIGEVKTERAKWVHRKVKRRSAVGKSRGYV
jgi:hypothetical protein